MRAVVDVNVLISSVLSGKGSSSEVLRAGRDGQFELIVSDRLIAELERTLTYPKLRKHIRPEGAVMFIHWVRAHATIAQDPTGPPTVNSRDPDDDYLIALAIERRAYLVTGDKDLLVRGDELPIVMPKQFLTTLRQTH